jgi:hypothetical protein
MKNEAGELRNLFKIIPMSQKGMKNGKNTVLETLDELPVYVNARNEFSRRMASTYNQKGINAESVYNEAVNKYNSGENGKAVELFETIREYSDSKKYIDKINKYFNFDGKLFNFFDKFFIYSIIHWSLYKFKL